MTARLRYFLLLWLVVCAAIVVPFAFALRDMSPMAMLIASAGGAALTFIVLGLKFVVESRQEKSRPREMEAYARTVGWSFEASTSSFDFGEWESLPLFSSAPHTRRAQNVIRGSRDAFAITVLDFSDEDGVETVACLRSSSLELPAFTLEGRVGSAGNPHEVIFEGNPHFARAYSVAGDNEAAIRSAFTPAVLDFFSTHKNLNVQGSGERLATSLDGDLLSPKRIPQLVEQSVAIAHLFMSPP